MAYRKRSVQLKKAIRYLENGIRKTRWECGTSIPTLIKISKSIHVSPRTVKKAAKVLCTEKKLQKISRSFIIIGMPKIHFATIQKSITDTKINFKAAELMNKGGFFDHERSAILLKKNKIIEIIKPLQNMYAMFRIESITDTLYKPINSKDALNNKKLTSMYRIQCRVKKYMDIIINNLDELGLK